MTPGDAVEAESSPENYPVLGSACTLSEAPTTISGTLNSTANAAFEIDLYKTRMWTLQVLARASAS